MTSPITPLIDKATAGERLSPEEGRRLLKRHPPMLQERFLERFNKLQDWEQALILSSLQRVVAMMEAGDIDAAPLLFSGPMQETEPQKDEES